MNLEKNTRIPLCNPILDKEMKAAALNALETEPFVLGEEVYKFEEEFAHYCGVKYGVSTNSGTVALQFSLIALGIEGKESHVITTPLSFIATANAIVHANSTPVFADIEAKTFCISTNQISKRISPAVKAIIPVHLYGYPADMQEITEISEDHDIKVVEDACQAHGAEYKGLKTGGIGDIGCFSFYPSKNMTVGGDGGMVVTNDEEIAQQVSKLRDCGRKSKYEHDIIGYTARLNTVNAAIGRVQLRRIDKWNGERRRKAALYDSLLADLNGVMLPPSGDSQIKPVYHVYVIRARKREELKRWLENFGIYCGVHYPLPIHLQPIYKKLFGFKEGEYPQSELVSQNCLSIPLYPDLSDDKIECISNKIREFYENSK